MEKNKNDEIDLLRLLGALWHKIWIIAVAAVLCAVLAFGYVNLFVPAQYESSVLIYVNNSSLSIGSTSLSISSGELTAAQKLVDTYLVILKSHTTFSQIRERSGVNYSDAKLSSMIRAGAVNKTEIFRVTVSSTDPLEAQRIANTIADVFPDILSGIVNGSSVKIIDYALVASGKSSPSVTKYTAIGFLLGLIASCGVIILIELFNDKIHDENTLAQMFKNVPVLANIPGLGTSGKTRSKYGKYGNTYEVTSAYDRAGDTKSDGR